MCASIFFHNCQRDDGKLQMKSLLDWQIRCNLEELNSDSFVRSLCYPLSYTHDLQGILQATLYVNLRDLASAQCRRQGNQEASKWTKWSNNNNNTDKWPRLLWLLLLLPVNAMMTGNGARGSSNSRGNKFRIIFTHKRLWHKASSSGKCNATNGKSFDTQREREI